MALNVGVPQVSRSEPRDNVTGADKVCQVECSAGEGEGAERMACGECICRKLAHDEVRSD